MSSATQRFAIAALAAFQAMGHTTDTLVSEGGGPSSTYMTGLRKAADGAPLNEPRTDTYARIERAAGWVRGSARDVWRGGEPKIQQSGRDRMKEILGLAPDDAPQPPVRRRYSDGPDGFAERIFDRLLDLEERVDALEARIEDPRPVLTSAANEDPTDPLDEAEQTEEYP